MISTLIFWVNLFFLESYALEPQEVATLLCKEGLYEDACSLLRSQDLEVTLPVKLLARSYACQISRPEGNELQTQLEGEKSFL